MHEAIELIRSSVLTLGMMTGDPASALLEERAFDCIARTVYAEARGEGVQGMSLVVQSIINRHTIQGKAPCRIAREAYDGYRLVRDRPVKSFNIESWDRARLVTLRVVMGNTDLGDCQSVTHFLNPRAVRRMPNWANRNNQICTVGNHVAYHVENI